VLKGMPRLGMRRAPRGRVRRWLAECVRRRRIEADGLSDGNPNCGVSRPAGSRRYLRRAVFACRDKRWRRKKRVASLATSCQTCPS
jgi:hypothetical protein